MTTLSDSVPLAQPYAIGGGGGAPRAGLVRAHGRAAVEDDGGTYFPLGVTAFPLVWLVDFDRPRAERNLRYAAEQGIQFVRILGEVGGDSWQDRTIDPREAHYEQTLADAIDLAWDHGQRTMLSIFGGGVVSPGDVPGVLAKIRRVVEPRLDRIQALEPGNEDNFPGTHEDCRAAVRTLRAWFPGLVAFHSPDDGSAETAAKDADICTALTLHTDRQDGDDGWRCVRQTWGINWPVPGIAGEPPGIALGQGEDLHGPLYAAALRTVGVLNGFSTFVLHCGAGVRMGGAYDQRYGRQANYDEVPGFAETAAALVASTALLPPESPNWMKTSQHGPDPFADNFLYADQIWSDGFNHGVSRAYLAYAGSEFVCVPYGVKDYVDLIAKQPVTFDVFDLLGAPVAAGVRLAAGQRYRLAGDPAGSAKAYVLKGTR